MGVDCDVMPQPRGDIELGARIRSLRVRRGLSLEELGRVLGMTRQGVGKWELGKAPVSSLNVRALSQALNVPIAELYGDGAQKPTRSRAPHSLTSGRDTTISDRVRDRLLAAWSDVPSEEVAAIDALAASLERWRAVLLQQEHAQQAPATNAAR